MIDDRLIYRIALTLIPGVGDVLGKKLVSLCGSAEAVFKEPRRHLRKLPRIGNILANATGNREILVLAEKEVQFIERFRITPLYFQDPDYPQRLKHCFDSPVLLYYKGVVDLNAKRVLGIVGTRNATAYGKSVTNHIIRELVIHQPLVISGLAYGIDGQAHRGALENGLNTVGVLGHGLDRIYPFLHKSLAEKMLTQGGLLTEFLSGSKPDRENFPKRNRIIAGLCDVIVVVEAAEKGGALITADIANSYHRDVFAIPGRVNDPYSAGTNFLIRTNKAALIQKPEDLEILMGWKQESNSTSTVQRKIFQELTPHEEVIVKLLEDRTQVPIDEIINLTELTTSQVATALLNLEFEGLIKCFPGKVYELL
ncbi:MAG: DNA-processing protein DprA [Bacteroidales bacterium]|nr:DNA-processing protein DprA [Bacteroidales bacterium]MDD4602977.1 DNA-processing protein DprA [Bacteroidales bacterium]